MTIKPIRRQHETTELPELYGAHCSQFKVVKNQKYESVSLLFIELDSAWHRFYLDAGLLFWEEGVAPDPENDLMDEDEYCDLGKTLNVLGVAIHKITMDDCLLRLEFKNSAYLVLMNSLQDDNTKIIEFKSASIKY